MGVKKIFQSLSRVFRKRKLKRRGLSVGVKRKTGETKRFVSFFESSGLSRAATGVVFVVLAVVIIWVGGYYYWPRLMVGQRSLEDVYASVGFTYRDSDETERQREEAARRVPVVYRLDETKAKEDLDRLIALLKNAQTAKEGSPAGSNLLDAVSAILNSLDRVEVEEIIATPEAPALLTKLWITIRKVYQYRIVAEPPPFPAERAGVEVRVLSSVQSELRDTIRKEFATSVNEVTGWLLRAVAFHFANISDKKYSRVDTEAGKKLAAFARKSVDVQFTTVREGARIIEKGEEITRSHLAQIEEMRRTLTQQRPLAARLLNLAGTALAVTGLVVGSAAFLARFHGNVFASNSRLILLSIVVLMSIGISKAVMYLHPASAFLGYPITVPFGSCVLSMMMGLRLSAFATIPMAVLLGMSFGSSLSPVLVGLLGGWAAAFFAVGVRHRKDFLKTGSVVGLVNGFTIAAIGALANTRLETLMVQAAGGVAVALGSILLAAVFLPMFEWAFKTPTDVTLVELTDSNHPLLKKMIMEAPGTYYHSLMVGNLAESASEAVGANPLLARVGSYFHDIGKLKKPLYFTENEAFGRSKHDTLTPSMSNLIILSHVKDGVDLACKHKLNRTLLDIIKQHHGTSLDYYFYRRAEEFNGGNVPVDEKEFRYPGPRPQSRESAIIMLADSVEAAARSLEKPTTPKIRAMVNSIIRAKFEDGQLDECDLTLKDLHTIEETFDRILVNTLHPRVKYPEEEKEDKGQRSERPVQEHAEDSEGVSE